MNLILLFPEDREFAELENLRDRIERCDVTGMTPLEALNFLNDLKGGIKKGGTD